MAAKRIIARFHPQAWINDYAIEVDPEGETEWDVTEQVLSIGREAALGLRDDDYQTDYLRLGENAPEWAREWGGPFYVEVEDSVREFFEATNTGEPER